MGRPRRPLYRVLLTSAILALVVAALLVAYLERRAAALQQEQTNVIVQQICDRTAAVLAAHIRKRLDSALFESIEGIGHPQMLAYDLPRIATYLADGYKRNPYVDRFFFWAEGRSPLSESQVVFYSTSNDATGRVAPVVDPQGRQLGSLVSEPELGREILRLARTEAPGQTFVVLERTIAGFQYQVILHPLWSNDRRLGFSSLIGYTVNLGKVDARMFHALLDEDVKTFLNPDSRMPTFAATLVDESGKVVYGQQVAPEVPSGRAALDLLFFPYEPLTQWLAGRPPVRIWQVVVSAPGSVAYTHFPGKWLVLAIVMLIVIAVVCAVSVERQATRLSRMQADFVANASHQLKTPLSLLSTAVETLTLDRVPPERQKEYLKILLSQTRRITSLVERILEFSRVEAGPNVYRMEPINLVSLVRAVVDRFRTESQQDKIPITFESSREVVIARADANAIEQAILNLLDNAIKYGDEQNRVTVAIAQSNGYAAISVRDEGFGIHSGDLPHIFGKFYRGRTGGDGRPGFGLGLAVVDSVARAHGGRATVQTASSRGSEFTLLLPAIPPNDHGLSDSRH